MLFGNMVEQYIWFDGKFVKFKNANVHILTHSMQYGSGIFEGIRSYQSNGNSYVFRLEDHISRFMKSAKIYTMNLKFSEKKLADAVVATLKKNKLKAAYIRPFAFYNDQHIGLGVSGKKISIAIITVPFGSYFANKEKGISCKVSSWQRINSMILPPEAKASGNYINSIIASIDAQKSGADEAILLSQEGHVAEGPGENVFFVEDGTLITPSREADILMGITRDTIIKLAEYNGLSVVERNVHKEEMYTCDEAFFTGTAAEVTPITSIDSRKIGNGKVGPITSMLADKYYEVVSGSNPEFKDWLTKVF